MTEVHTLQASRYEYKYIVDEAMMPSLREFARGYVQPDEHAQARRNWEYEVCSLYLDSPSLTLCRATMHGLKNRFKLRIRFYDHAPNSPAYFEIKRRVSDVVLKERAAVRRQSVGRLLAGGWPSLSDLFDGDASQFVSLKQFCSLRDAIRADGQVFVSYKREAYVAPNDDSLRVTFDRQVSAMPYGRNWALFSSQEPVYPKIDGLVLEVKFTDRFPNWIRQMVEVFDLERVSVAKYVACIECLTSHPMRYTMDRRRARA